MVGVRYFYLTDIKAISQRRVIILSSIDYGKKGIFMNAEKKIEILRKRITVLENENEKMKNENKALLDKQQKLIDKEIQYKQQLNAMEELRQTYQDGLSAIKELKNEYQQIIHEVGKLKKEYSKQFNSLSRRFRTQILT